MQFAQTINSFIFSSFCPERREKLQDSANAIEVDAARHKTDDRPGGRLEVHEQGIPAKRAPDGDDQQIKRPQPLHPHRVQEVDRQECQEHGDCHDSHRGGRAGIHHEQGKDHHVPYDGKAREEILIGLHAHIGIIDGARYHDHAGRHKRPGFADHATLVKRKGGQEHIGDIVDDIVQRIAGPVWQYFLDPHLACDGSVDAINEQRQPQPPEHVHEAVFGSRDDAEEGQK
ncbi:hypothetical protein AT6N2_C0461 [Agrobacterium tumefaciens]|nr:hypothetical protein AT6N2_C0461 [Agrobacterium tumefaciens]